MFGKNREFLEIHTFDFVSKHTERYSNVPLMFVCGVETKNNKNSMETKRKRIDFYQYTITFLVIYLGIHKKILVFSNSMEAAITTSSGTCTARVSFETKMNLIRRHVTKLSVSVGGIATSFFLLRQMASTGMIPRTFNQWQSETTKGVSMWCMMKERTSSEHMP